MRNKISWAIPCKLDNLLAEAQAIFPNTRLARDFLTVEIPRWREQAKEAVPV
jgi:ribonuclease Z